jgi:hypothetical protein
LKGAWDVLFRMVILLTLKEPWLPSPAKIQSLVSNLLLKYFIKEKW